MLISQQKLNTPRIRNFIFHSICSRNSKKIKKILQNFIPLKNKHIYWAGSGRCALRYILENIKHKRNFKDDTLKIGLPSFTCHVVLDSILRARCRPVFIDSNEIVSIGNLKKKTSKINALILPYNFGFMPEIDKIQKICKKNKIILIEDCAQALGSLYKSKLAGDFGDYSFYSFGISKNIGFLGGLILSKERLDVLPKANYSINHVLNTIIKSLLSNIFFNKHIYSYTNFFLRLELNKKQEPLDYNLPKFCQNTVTNMFKNYDKALKLRKGNAALCMKELKGVVSFVEPIKNSDPSWLYFVLLSKNKEKRNELIKQLRKEGIELMPLLTYMDLSKKGKLAKQIEQRYCCFALYRSRHDIDCIIKKIKKVSS